MNIGSLPLIPTSVVGSAPWPGYHFLIQEAIDAGRMGPGDVAEFYDDAVRMAMLDQETAGIDVISDGEMRRPQLWVLTFLHRMHGIEAHAPYRRLGAIQQDTLTGFNITDRLSAPQGLGIVAEFEAARAQTSKPLRQPVPGPFSLGLIAPLHIKTPAYSKVQDIYDDLVRIVRDEIEALAAAGCTLISIDEPMIAYAMQPDQKPGEFETARRFEHIHALTGGIQGVDFALHICFGNNQGRPSGYRKYGPLQDYLAGLPVQQFLFEYANRNMDEIELWRGFEGPQTIGVGVIDVKSKIPDEPWMVAERLREALKYIPAEKLWAVPDCGFSMTGRVNAVKKMRALVEGTNIVRQEVLGA